MTLSISWIDRAGLAETLARFGPGALEGGGLGPGRRPVIPVRAPLHEPTVEKSSPQAGFSPPAGHLHQKLEAFIDWLLQTEGGNVAFVIDRDGLPLADRGTDADLLAVASSVMQLIERMNRRLKATVGHVVTIQLEEGQLILISVTTPIGEYIVGHVDRRAPDPTMQRATTEALQAAFQSEEKRTLG